MSIDAKRTAASWAFVGVLVLSVVWPSPVVAINDVCCHAPISVDDLSFLGREAPSWDVVFWGIAGMLAIALLQDARDWRVAAEEWRAMRFRVSRRSSPTTAD